jgi:mycofactocin biosynthesis protein MftB
VSAGTPPICRSEGPAFDPGRPYRCSPSVAVRPEPFGALVYHFGTRRLSFLKTPQLVDVVSGLEHHSDAHGAVEAAGVAQPQRPAYLRALAGLAANGTIEERL